MIALKPIYLWKYLSFKKTRIPKDVKKLFYLSWEDGLWDILDKKNVKKGSTVLVPEFFCGDVEDNIRNHGYRIAHYPVSPSLITTNRQLIFSIKKHSPSVLVIFHMVGIANRLMDGTSWTKYLGRKSILIEDCVHRVVDPAGIRFIKSNHFIINSLRKVVPLQGSVLYGKSTDLDFSLPPPHQSFIYSLKVHLLWAAMNIFWILKMPIAAKKAMKTGYGLIGDSIRPARGFIFFDFFQRFIDIKKVKEIKRKQVEFYEKHIKITIPYSKKDRGELVGYPVYLPLKKAGEIIKAAYKNKLFLDFELNDSLWSKKQKIIYLPLGPYLKDEDLKKIIDIFSSSSLVL